MAVESLAPRGQDAALKLIVETAVQMLGVRRGCLYLPDGSSGRFRGRVSNLGDDVDGELRRLVCGSVADGLTAEILASREPVAIAHVAGDPRPVRSAMRRWGVRSILGIPLIDGEDVAALLFVDDGDQHCDFTARRAVAAAFGQAAGVAVTQALAVETMRLANGSALRQAAVFRRAAQIEERLLEVACEGASLGRLATTVAAFTRQSCVLYNAQGIVLAEAPAPDAPDLIVRLPLDRPDLLPARVARMMSTMDERQPIVLPACPDAGVMRRSIVARQHLDSETTLTIVLGEASASLTRADVHVARRVVMIAAALFNPERRLAAYEAVAREALAAALIDGVEDGDALAHRCAAVGIDPHGPRAVCVVSSPAGEQPQGAARLVERLAADPRLDALVTSKGDHHVLCVACVAQDGESAISTLREIVDAHRSETTAEVLVGISSICHDTRDVALGHREALRVLAALECLVTPASVRTLGSDELGAGALLLSSCDAQEAERFARATLGPLMESKSTRGSLLETVNAYFLAGRNVRVAASALGVHENTIRYRLARIEELTRQNILTESQAELNVQLALLVLRLRGDLRSDGSRPGIEVVGPPAEAPLDGAAAGLELSAA